MPRRSLRTFALLVTVACVLAPPVAQADVRPATVTRIVDGDTIVTSAGRVRLVQIDTPEVHGASECYGRESSAALRRMLPPGTHVRLQTDPALDRRDRYGRLLAYVWRGGSLVNLQLVREGAAAPYFFSGVQGAYARAILRGAVAARKAGKGLWGHCRNGSVALHTNIAVATGPVAGVAAAGVARLAGSGCDANYTGGCVPDVPYDLDCGTSRSRSPSSATTRTVSTGTGTGAAASRTAERAADVLTDASHPAASRRDAGTQTLVLRYAARDRRGVNDGHASRARQDQLGRRLTSSTRGRRKMRSMTSSGSGRRARRSSPQQYSETTALLPRRELDDAMDVLGRYGSGSSFPCHQTYMPSAWMPSGADASLDGCQAPCRFAGGMPGTSGLPVPGIH